MNVVRHGSNLDVLRHGSIIAPRVGAVGALLQSGAPTPRSVVDRLEPPPRTTCGAETPIRVPESNRPFERRCRPEAHRGRMARRDRRRVPGRSHERVHRAHPRREHRQAPSRQHTSAATRATSVRPPAAPARAGPFRGLNDTRRAGKVIYSCYSMLMLTRRLQILVDEERFSRLERAAARRGSSVAAVVRDAIDTAYPSDAQEKRRAAKAIASSPQLDLPDPDALRRELDDVRARRA